MGLPRREIDGPNSETKRRTGGREGTHRRTRAREPKQKDPKKRGFTPPPVGTPGGGAPSGLHTIRRGGLVLLTPGVIPFRDFEPCHDLSKTVVEARYNGSSVLGANSTLFLKPRLDLASQLQNVLFKGRYSGFHLRVFWLPTGRLAQWRIHGDRPCRRGSRRPSRRRRPGRWES